MIPQNKSQKHLEMMIRKVSSEVALGHIKKEGKKQVNDIVSSTLAFRNQRATANPKSGIETATKDSAGAGTFLPLSGGTITGNFEIQGNVGFYNTTPVNKPIVTGSKGANAALTSLMSALSALGLVTDSTT